MDRIWPILDVPMSEFTWCDRSQVVPGATLHDIRLYSKVDSKSMVLFITEHNITDVVFNDKDIIVKDCKVTTLYTVRPDGRISWKHAGKWGAGTHRKEREFYKEAGNAIANGLMDAREELLAFLCALQCDSRWFGGMKPSQHNRSPVPVCSFEGVLEFLAFSWFHTYCPHLSYEACDFAGRVFMTWKKPVLTSGDTDEVTTKVFERLTSHQRTLALKLLELRGNKNNGDRVNDRAYRIREAMENATELTNPYAARVYVEALQNGTSGNYSIDTLVTFFDAFPHVSLVQELLSPTNYQERNELSRKMNDTVVSLKKMTKRERQLAARSVEDDTADWGVAAGPTLAAVRESVRSVRREVTTRRLDENFTRRCDEFVFPDVIKAYENPTFRLVHPSEYHAFVVRNKVSTQDWMKDIHNMLRGKLMVLTDRDTNSLFMSVWLNRDHPYFDHARMPGWEVVNKHPELTFRCKEWATFHKFLAPGDVTAVPDYNAALDL